ncbi:hypothetical protein N7468_010278 [Penicillium chermesinum]|uniref:ATP phosphoribosyltransferase n=1 Tax=Penicillium chermesinum TaxID=63820 RepID=A0A9W9NCD8_9EURO|nr:uncharacterized protein N7468_010278 [Penicillium chermesinum]KAJ5217270.1 hypothetical protein N7468_010278 [Penicillium chermesinum]KAJ6171119.1 hypothetical protein N7470_000186 [Penicillium chermesinum]
MAGLSVQKFTLVFFAPSSAVAGCKKAIFAAGAGRYPGPGNYTECCWTARGMGQFRPGDAANPNIGKVGQLEEVEEVRVETLCVGEDIARKAVEALKSAHPYEEPSYSVYRMEDF